MIQKINIKLSWKNVQIINQGVKNKMNTQDIKQKLNSKEYDF